MDVWKRGQQVGFTLVELLIVVGIIGILAAIAVPNLMTAMHRTKQKRTMADIRQNALAWENYETEHSRYVAAGYTLFPIELPPADLKAQLEPTYIRSVNTDDGWGRSLRFGTDEVGTLADRYQIISYGRDGIAQEDAFGPTTNFDNDIVYENGSFVTFPALN